jgi:hypothetical protein
MAYSKKNHITSGSIALLGDVALDGLFRAEPGKNGRRFAAMAPILQSFPLVLANLETPLSGENEFNEAKKNGKGVIHYTDETTVKEILPLLNIAGVSQANNHIYDCGKSGVINTVKCLETLGIKFAGAGYAHEHLEPVFFDIGGKRIGFTAYADRATNPCIPDNAGIHINYFDEETVTEKIEEIKKECDTLILSIHWGRDYSSYPTKQQRETARRLIDAGADIIMGHHTHTLQPFETYKNGLIFYSLGSFCYGDFLWEGKLRALKRKTKKSMVAVIDIDDKQPKISTIIPTRELKGNTVISGKRPLNNRRKLFYMRLFHRYRFLYRLQKIKEVFIDRVFEYFFGYYRNPLVQLFSVANLKKISYIKRDYSS